MSMDERENASDINDLLCSAGPGREFHEAAQVAAAEAALAVLAEKPPSDDQWQVLRGGYGAVVVGLLLLLAGVGNAGRFASEAVSGIGAGGLGAFRADAVAMLLTYAQALFGMGLFLGGLGFRRRMETGRQVVLLTLVTAFAFLVIGPIAFTIYVFSTRRFEAYTVVLPLFAIVTAGFVAYYLRGRIRLFGSRAAIAWCRRGEPGAEAPLELDELDGHSLVAVACSQRQEHDAARVAEAEKLIRERAGRTWIRMTENFRKARRWLAWVGALVAFSVAGAAFANGVSRVDASAGLAAAWLASACIMAAAFVALLAGVSAFDRRRRWGRLMILAALAAGGIGILCCEILLLADTGLRNAFTIASLTESGVRTLAALASQGFLIGLAWAYFSSPKARLWSRG